MDRHRRVLFPPDRRLRFRLGRFVSRFRLRRFVARAPLRFTTRPFDFLGETRLRFAVGLGVEGPASSATTALATQTICGRPLSNSFQVLPASREAYSFPLRVPK